MTTCWNASSPASGERSRTPRWARISTGSWPRPPSWGSPSGSASPPARRSRPGCSSRPGGAWTSSPIADLDAFTAACHDRHERTGKGHQHYLAAVSNTQRVLFHLGIVDQLPRSGGPVPFAERLAEVRATDPRDDDRLPGTQAGDLPGQDGLGDRDPAQALRGVPRPRRPRPGLDRPPRPPPTHRALPDLAGRRGERQER